MTTSSNRYAAQLAGAPACGAGEESSNLSDLICPNGVTDSTIVFGTISLGSSPDWGIFSMEFL